MEFGLSSSRPKATSDRPFRSDAGIIEESPGGVNLGLRAAGSRASLASRATWRALVRPARLRYHPLAFSFLMQVPMSERTADSNIPQNLEAERSVLGAILLENRAINQAQEILSADDFFRDGHRRIFRAMGDLSERAAVIDLVTIKEELGREGSLDTIGGPAYISSLVDGVPRSSNIEHYAKIVKEKSILRALIDSSQRIVASAFRSEEPTDSILDEAQRQIFAITQDRIRDGFIPLRELADPTLKRIEQLTQAKEMVTGVASGFERFDELTSGFQPTDLVVIAGRPSMGKTAFCLNVALHAATNHGKRVGVFSLEMSREQLFLRMLCCQARIDAHRLRTGRLNKDEWTRMSKGFGELTEASTIFSS